MDKIIILDFGGQYCHLIARRIRDFGVSTEVVSSDISADDLSNDADLKGIIISGGARSVYEDNAPTFDEKLLDVSVPVLGICYGHQLIANHIGGKVIAGTSGEYGLTKLNVQEPVGVLSRLDGEERVWMNHRDVVVDVPKPFVSLAETEHSKIAAFMDPSRKIFSVQFHPEVSHTEHGDRILKNFVFDICRCQASRSMTMMVENIIKEAKEVLGEEKAIIALSGGIDSSVAATLVSKAVGKNLIAVYVDTGLMRQGETEEVQRLFQDAGFNFRVIQAEQDFFNALQGITSPEEKRKIIGKLFIDIFSTVAKKENATVLVQGTIYSDRIESGVTKHASIIKSHHNVGGLPERFNLRLHEPLKELYKDEVRKLAKELKLPEAIGVRQVFPGPGLAIRIVGEVTPERTQIVRQASYIIEEELKKTENWKSIWMSFAILLPIRSVGVQGDERTYKHSIVVRIVESRDAMTASFSKLPWEVLERISTRITNELKEVNRVVYDITHKPPATMEWE